MGSSWAIFDSLYHPTQYFASHLDSYGHYLAEYGEDVTRCCLANAPIEAGGPGWESPAEAFVPGESYLDYAFFLDGYQHALRVEGARVKRIAQVAAVCSPMPWEVRKPDGSPAFDLVISSLPHMVDAARDAGCTSRYQPLAFDLRARACMMGVKRERKAIFCGTVGPNHARRAWWLRELRDIVEVLPPLYGRDYFRALASARVVFSVHAEWAKGAANCMRLFEATGMGAAVVSDGTRPDVPEWPRPFHYEARELPEARDLVEGMLKEDWRQEVLDEEIDKSTQEVLLRHTYEHRIPDLVRWARSL